MNADAPSLLAIAEVERATGIGKDTLRVWERRYGFPVPQRDAQGERRYDEPQVQRLCLLRRLMDQGHRPGRIVPLPMAALQALDVAAEPPRPPVPARRGRPPRVSRSSAPGLDPAWLALIRANQVDALRSGLHREMLQRGLVAALEEVLAPLGHAVGRAWAAGELSVFQEHLFSEAVEAVLREAIAGLDAPGNGGRRGPRVLLTTLPGEQHMLGLLMAETVLALQGCERVALGPSTPVAEIAEAARRLQVDVVALGASAHAVPRALRTDLLRLRGQLPVAVDLWVGGAGAAALGRGGLPSVTPVGRAADIAALVAAWRAARSGDPQAGAGAGRADQ